MSQNVFNFKVFLPANEWKVSVELAVRNMNIMFTQTISRKGEEDKIRSMYLSWPVSQKEKT
jgi:hypothetical protein